MNIYKNTIRNNIRVIKTKMCVTHYTNKIWAQSYGTRHKLEIEGALNIAANLK